MENSTIELIASFIRNKQKNTFTNISEVKLLWHNVSYVCVCYLNYLKLFPNEKFNLKRMEELCLVPGSLTKFYRANKEDLFTILESLNNSDYKNDVHSFRGLLLDTELKISKNEIRIITSKVAKDTTGSYYTPSDLAYSVCKRTFENYTGDIKKARIIDLSCGDGEFLTAARKCLAAEYKLSPATVSKMLWGIDVDPIALQIAICSILSDSSQKSWPEIISHFVLGNPLLCYTQSVSFDNKNTLFALGRIYSPEMGLDIDAQIFSHSFDIVLGNPPWEKIRFEERKFFKNTEESIALIPQKDERTKEINKLSKKWPELLSLYELINHDYSIINSTSYSHPLIKHSVAGELNTYALFTELAFNILTDTGICGYIVKSTLATAPAHSTFWTYLMSNKYVVGTYFFQNNKKIFAIDSRERFLVLLLSKTKKPSFAFATGLETPNDLDKVKSIKVTSKDIQKINPFTGMIPNISATSSLAFLKKMHKDFPLFADVFCDCHFGRLIHLTAHANYIEKQQSDKTIPIYEGKFIEQYDARYSTFAGMSTADKYKAKASAVKNNDTNKPKALPESRFFVDKELWAKYQKSYCEDFSLCWRSLTSPTNRRTMIAMILPTCPTCQSIQMLQTKDAEELVILLALFNSKPFDYLVRLKMPGIDLTQSVIKQIPVPSVDTLNKKIKFNGKTASIKKHIVSYAASLLIEEPLLASLIETITNKTYPINKASLDIQKEIDLLFKEAYQLSDNEYVMLLNSFK